MMKKFIRNISAITIVAALSLGSMAPAFAQTTHTVTEGEWLWGIARQYGLTAGDIMAYNGLASENVYPGTVLYIPSNSSAPITGGHDETSVSGALSGVHVVQPGDTLSGIAALYGLSVEQLQAWNGIGNQWLQIGQQIVLYGDPNATPPAPSTSTTPAYSANYYVKPGDTLSGLAYANGVSLADIYAVNGLYSDWLYVGQPLIIPGVAYPVPSAQVYTEPRYTEPTDQTWIEAPSQETSQNNQNTTQISSPTDDEEETTTTRRPSQRAERSQEEIEANQAAANSNLVVDGMRVADLPKRARPKVHVVETGDTLDSLAVEYNTTKANIISWNRLVEDEELEEGRELFVSNPALIPKLHEVAEGETLYDIAQEYETTEQWIMHWNELEDNVAPVGELVIVSNPDPEIHEVEAGQTLQEIADLYEIELDDLKEWNDIPERVTIVNGTLIVSDPRVGNEEELEELTEESSQESEEESTTVEETSAE